MAKTILVLCVVVGIVILLAIGWCLAIVFSGSTRLKTDDGRETSYFRKLGKIHYMHSDNIFSLIYSPVYGADSKTFKPIGGGFGKDKKYFYYMQIKQPQLDYATFEITEDGVYRDKNHTYRIKYETLVPIVTKYQWFEALVADNQRRLQIGSQDTVRDEWFKYYEKQLAHPLPDSYKWFQQKYDFMVILTYKGGNERIKYISSPDRGNDYDERDILVRHRVNLKNKTYPANYLCVLENDDDLYFLLMENGGTEHEYQVHKTNKRSGETELYADNFLHFVKKRIEQSKR